MRNKLVFAPVLCTRGLGVGAVEQTHQQSREHSLRGPRRVTEEEARFRAARRYVKAGSLLHAV